jgi:hypothetical protein
MSAEIYLAIHCDHLAPGDTGQPERCNTEWSHPTYVATHRELRRHLKKHGWRRTRDGRDLCPEHAASPTAEPTSQPHIPADQRHDAAQHEQP